MLISLHASVVDADVLRAMSSPLACIRRVLGLPPPRKKQDMNTEVFTSQTARSTGARSVSRAPASARYSLHPNGGGRVASTASVGPNVYVAPTAEVLDSAVVTGAVRLFGRSRIEGQAIVVGTCTLREDASVGGDAVLRGNVTMVGYARVEGLARISGGVRLEHRALITAGAIVGSFTIR